MTNQEQELELALLNVRLRSAVEDGLSPRVISHCYGVSLEHAAYVYWQTQNDIRAQRIADLTPQVKWHNA